MYNALVISARDTWSVGQAEPQIHLGFHCMLTHGRGRHAITALYRALHQIKADQTKPSWSRWKTAQGHDLSDKQWDMSLEMTKRVSRNARLKFTQFNYVHHTYLTPQRLHNMFPGVSSECPRCGHTDATFIHMVWECQPLARVWEQIVERISEIIWGTLAM